MPPPTATIRVLGVDPGVRITGFGVVDIQDGAQARPRLVEAGCIRPHAKSPLSVRLREIYDGLATIIAETKPQVLALESIFAHLEHPQPSIVMAHARGVICLLGAQHDLRRIDLTAPRVKRALTGAGRASKAQVAQAVAQMLGLIAPPTPADITDALALCLAVPFATLTGEA